MHKKKNNYYARRFGNNLVQLNVRNSHKWQLKREEIKQRDGGVDQIAINGLDGTPYIQTKKLQVHHIIPIDERPDLAYTNVNLITVSPRTHDLFKITCEQEGVDYSVVEKLLSSQPTRCTVVSGAPGSGKSYYVSQHKGKDDLVWDLDLICEALQGELKYGNLHDPVLGIAIKLRDTVFNDIIRGKGRYDYAWVITSESDPKQVSDLCMRLGARHKHINTPLETCLKNIDGDTRPHDKQERINVCKKWFAECESKGGFKCADVDKD